jgi:Major capsid protein Gp23
MLSLSISTQRCTSTMPLLNDQLQKLCEEWLNAHGINAVYTVTETYDPPYSERTISRKLKFATPKDEFKYRLMGGSRAMRRYVWSKMGELRKEASLQLARDICGVQPMQGPAGQIFKLKVRYELDKR